MVLDPETKKAIGDLLDVAFFVVNNKHNFCKGDIDNVASVTIDLLEDAYWDVRQRLFPISEDNPTFMKYKEKRDAKGPLPQG